MWKRHKKASTFEIWQAVQSSCQAVCGAKKTKEPCHVGLQFCWLNDWCRVEAFWLRLETGPKRWLCHDWNGFWSLTYLSIHLSIHLSIRLSIYLSIHLSHPILSHPIRYYPTDLYTYFCSHDFLLEFCLIKSVLLHSWFILANTLLVTPVGWPNAHICSLLTHHDVYHPEQSRDES